MIFGEGEDFEKAGLRPEDLSTGVLVGTIEIEHLANPERLTKLFKPKRYLQPAWFRPAELLTD